MDYLDMSTASNPWKKHFDHSFNQLIMLSDTPHFQLLPSHEIEEDYEQSETAMKLNTLVEMAKTASEIHHTRRSQVTVELDKESCDLTRCKELEKKLDYVKKLVTNLEAVIKNQDLLTSRLQRPEQENHLLLEAKYHPSAKSLFQNVATCLSNLQEQCELLKWHKHHSVEDKEVLNSLRDISQRYLQVKESMQLMSRVCDKMTKDVKVPSG